MKLFRDIGELLSLLSFADIIFFFAIIVLIILIVILIYFIQINSDDIDETAEMKIVREIDKDMKKEVPNIEFTDYEKEQENKAIISYEELIKQNNSYDINYEKEDLIDDVSVKKVNLDQITNKTNNVKPKMEVRVISFAEEEAFLQALKQLQKELG